MACNFMMFSLRMNRFYGFTWFLWQGHDLVFVIDLAGC